MSGLPAADRSRVDSDRVSDLLDGEAGLLAQPPSRAVARQLAGENELGDVVRVRGIEERTRLELAATGVGIQGPAHVERLHDVLKSHHHFGEVFRRNRDVVDEMFAETGAFIFGRRTYDITKGWGGRHPINGVPVLILTHKPPAPETVPKGPSNLTFVTDGIASAIDKAKVVAAGKDIKLGGASPGKQALEAGLCDEILVHVAPYLLGEGVPLFGTLPTGIKLEKLSVRDGPLATHIRYRVVR